MYVFCVMNCSWSWISHPLPRVSLYTPLHFVELNKNNAVWKYLHLKSATLFRKFKILQLQNLNMHNSLPWKLNKHIVTSKSRNVNLLEKSMILDTKSSIHILPRNVCVQKGSPLEKVYSSLPSKFNTHIAASTFKKVHFYIWCPRKLTNQN